MQDQHTADPPCANPKASADMIHQLPFLCRP